MLDVVNFVIPKMRPFFRRQEIKELRDHCSGLVRINKDDMYLSQTAWFTYASMTRVAKEYRFNLGARA